MLNQTITSENSLSKVKNHNSLVIENQRIAKLTG